MNLHESDISERGKVSRVQGIIDQGEETMPLATKPPTSDPLSLDAEHHTKADANEYSAEGGDKNEQLSYEERRLKLKFGYWQSAVIIFQSTVGISWFTLHQPLLKVGLYLGALITLLSGYITTYGLLLLDETAAMVERDQERTVRTKNVEELCAMLKHKLAPAIKWTMMFASLGMIFASSISNLCLMADTVEHYFHIPQWQTKLMTFLIISIFLVFIIEPEGIESVTYITTVLLTFLGRIG